MEKLSSYETQAIEFCRKHGVKITKKFVGRYARLSETPTNQWEVTIERNNKKMSVLFGDSISSTYGQGNNPNCDGKLSYKRKETCAELLTRQIKMDRLLANPVKPSDYSILACLTKNDPGSHENFCADCGYDTDSRKALDTYLAVAKEWEGIKRLFGDNEILNELAEIN